MRFEWDEEKRARNQKKHKVDFVRAARMFEAPDQVELFPDPRHKGEKRAAAIGQVDGVWHCLIYDDRGDVLRLISAWKLNEKSKKKSEKRFARRAARDGEEGGALGDS